MVDKDFTTSVKLVLTGSSQICDGSSGSSTKPLGQIKFVKVPLNGTDGSEGRSHSLLFQSGVFNQERLYGIIIAGNKIGVSE